MPRLESSIQRSVVEYAKKRGLLAKKLSVQGPMGNTGWPDFMLLAGPTNKPEDDAPWAPRIIFIEFKKQGGKLTPLQEETKKQIEARGFKYYVVDDAQEGKEIIDAELS